MIRKIMTGIFRRLGYELHPVGRGTLSQSMEDVLSKVRNMDFNPKTIFDVGVADGTFPLYNAFPDAYIVLIEPLIEFEHELKSILRTRRGTYVLAVASGSSGEIQINVHTHKLNSSSIYQDTMGSRYDGVSRTVPLVRIDDLVSESGFEGPFVIKADVQGAELEVIDGSTGILMETELILLEASLFQFVKGGPQFYDIVIAMKDHGFVLYDLFGGVPRPLDNALGQIDLAFVREDGHFRKNHAFGTIDR